MKVIYLLGQHQMTMLIKAPMPLVIHNHQGADAGRCEARQSVLQPAGEIASLRGVLGDRRGGHVVTVGLERVLYHTELLISVANRSGSVGVMIVAFPDQSFHYHALVRGSAWWDHGIS